MHARNGYIGGAHQECRWLKWCRAIGGRGEAVMYHEHGHEYHYAMPLGIMICVYCGECKDVQMNKLLRNLPTTSKIPQPVIVK